MRRNGMGWTGKEICSSAKSKGDHEQKGDHRISCDSIRYEDFMLDDTSIPAVSIPEEP